VTTNSQMLPGFGYQNPGSYRWEEMGVRLMDTSTTGGFARKAGELVLEGSRPGDGCVDVHGSD